MEKAQCSQLATTWLISLLEGWGCFRSSEVVSVTLKLDLWL